MNLLQKVTVMLALGLPLDGVTLAARPPMQVVENSFESTTFSLSLPRSVPARLSFRPCITCNTETLQMATSSEFYIGKEAVPYARFTAYAKAKSRDLTIHFTPETRVITRLVASAQ